MTNNDPWNIADCSDPIPTQTAAIHTLNPNPPSPPPPPPPPPHLLVRIGDEEHTDQSSSSDEDESDDERRRILERLTRKIKGEDQPAGSSTILEVNRYELDIDPQNLAERCPPNEKNEWLFFARRTKPEGYWSATHRAETSIIDDGEEIGFSRKLEYCTGTPPQGYKTGWTMLEYTSMVTDQTPSKNTTKINDWVLCKIFKEVNKKRKSQAVEEGDGVEAAGKNPKLGDALEEQFVAGSQEIDSNRISGPIETEDQLGDPSSPVLGLIESENPSTLGGASEEQFIPGPPDLNAGQEIDLNPVLHPFQIDNQAAVAPILGLHAGYQVLNPFPEPIQAEIPRGDRGRHRNWELAANGGRHRIPELGNRNDIPLQNDIQRLGLDEAMEVLRQDPDAFPPPPTNIQPP